VREYVERLGRSDPAAFDLVADQRAVPQRPEPPHPPVRPPCLTIAARSGRSS